MFASRVEHKRREYIDSEYKMQSCPDFLKRKQMSFNDMEEN